MYETLLRGIRIYQSRGRKWANVNHGRYQHVARNSNIRLRHLALRLRSEMVSECLAFRHLQRAPGTMRRIDTNDYDQWKTVKGGSSLFNASDPKTKDNSLGIPCLGPQ